MSRPTLVNKILNLLSHFPDKKWAEFSLKLGLDKSTLDEIRAEFGPSVSSCLRECLTRWLDKQDDEGGVNYDSLADALRSIGEIAVAENISQQLIPYLVNHLEESSLRHHSELSILPEYPYNDEKSELSAADSVKNALFPTTTFDIPVPDTCTITLNDVWKMILNNNSLAINTLAVAACGLPLCGKTGAMFRMILDVLPPNHDQNPSLAEEVNDKCLSAFNLCLLGGNPFPDFHFIRTTKLDRLIYFILCDIIRTGVLKYNDPLCFSFDASSHYDESLFASGVHNTHIHWLFDQIKDVYPCIKMGELKVGYFHTGASIINAFDVSVNKALYDFLPIVASLCPKLARLTFFSLDRDVDNMSSSPDLKTSEKYVNDVQISQVLQWNSRLRYLLHHAAAGYSCNSDRDQTTIMIGVTESLDDDAAQQKLDKARHIIMEEAEKLGIEKVFSEWLYINSTSKESLSKGRKKLEKNLLHNPHFRASLPLKWIFLRSLLASIKINGNIPITMEKQKIMKLAKELEMNDEEVDQFLKTFTSFASILYSNKFCGTVILDIQRFSELLHKLYNPIDHNSLGASIAAKYGIITESYAKILLNSNARATLKILTSCSLLAELKYSQAFVPGVVIDENESLYFLPSSRVSPIVNGDQNDSLTIFITSKQVPVNSQASIAKYMLQELPNITLVATEAFNVTKFKLHCENSNSDIEVDIVYLGKTTELRICNSDVNRSVMELCSKFLSACCNALVKVDYERGLRFNIALPCCAQKDYFHFFTKKRKETKFYDYDAKFCEQCKTQNHENSKRRCWVLAVKKLEIEMSADALHNHNEAKLDPKFVSDIVTALNDDPGKHSKKEKFVTALDLKDTTALQGLDGWQYYMMCILLWDKERERTKEDLRVICTFSLATVQGATTPLVLNLPTSPCCCSSNPTGPIYYDKLDAVKDVWLEGTTNKNSYDFLIFGKHPQYPKKRILIQFQDIPKTCKNVTSAKLRLHYWYSHKASWQTDAQAPHIPRTVQVHQIKKSWSETAATTIKRDATNNWSKPYLAIDGTDADPCTLDTVCFHSESVLELDITEAAKNWHSGDPNNGVLIWVTNEDCDGRDVRFYSREKNDESLRPALYILCEQ